MTAPETINHPSLAAILLAAGGSSRLGRPKQLIEIDGQTLVARQAKLLSEAGFRTTLVVTGAAQEQVEAQLTSFPVECIFNSNWQDGMGASLACGIRALAAEVDAVLVLLCDQWRVGPTDLAALIQVWQQNPDRVVVSAWEGGGGPPAIFPRELFDALGQLNGEEGARLILDDWPVPPLQVMLPNAAFDLDVEADIPKG